MHVRPELVEFRGPQEFCTIALSLLEYRHGGDVISSQNCLQPLVAVSVLYSQFLALAPLDLAAFFLSGAMASVSSINRLAQDRGLAAVFQSSGVKPEHVELLKKKYNWEILEDFCQWFPRGSDEGAIRTAVDQACNAIPELLDNKIIQGRVMSAVDVGRAAMSLSLTASPGSMGAADDEEKALDDATAKTVDAEWENRYSFEFDPFVDPSDGLKAKVYREFRKKSANAPPARKCKSVMVAKLPDSSDVVNLPGNVKLSLDAQRDLKLEDIVSYYFAVTTLTNAWAWAGNYLTESKLQKDSSGTPLKVLMISFSAAVAYAQFCLRMVLTYGGSSVRWLQQRDEATRSRMAANVRRGYPAGEALERALEETHQDWRSRHSVIVDDVPLEDVRKTASSGSGGGGGGGGRDKRPRTDRPSPKETAKRRNTGKGGSGGTSSEKTVSMIKGGQRLCKPYNDNRGCTSSSCKDLHECDVRLESGKHCGARDHNRHTHR